MNKSDIALSPMGSFQSGTPVVKVMPVYLVSYENPSIKGSLKTQYFLASKLEETSYCIKAIGVDIEKDIEGLVENYQKVLQSSDKRIYKEIRLPWHRVNLIQNLIYKHK